MNKKNYRNLIASMDCARCGATGPSELHHIRAGQGMSQRASDYLAIPLCPNCHRHSPDSIHQRNTGELDLLASTLENVIGGLK